MNRRKKATIAIDRLAVSRLVGLLPRLYPVQDIAEARNRLVKGGLWKDTDLRRLLEEKQPIRDKDHRLFLALVKELGGMKGLACRIRKLETQEMIGEALAINYAIAHPGTSTLYMIRK